MKILKIGLLTALLAGCSSQPKNFAECVLDNMPGVSNESVRFSIHRQCSAKFPDRFNEIQKGSGLGFGADFKNRDECVIEKNKNTTNQNATININIACSCLYKKPSYDGEICNGNPFSQ